MIIARLKPVFLAIFWVKAWITKRVAAVVAWLVRFLEDSMKKLLFLSLGLLVSGELLAAQTAKFCKTDSDCPAGDVCQPSEIYMNPGLCAPGPSLLPVGSVCKLNSDCKSNICCASGPATRFSAGLQCQLSHIACIIE